MDVEGSKWVTLPKYSDGYRKGVGDFITNAFRKYASGNELKCPCKKCGNRYWKNEKAIHEHLICNGPSVQSIEWIYEVSNFKIIEEDEMDTDIGVGLGGDFEAMIRNTYRNTDEYDPPVRKGLNDYARNFYKRVEEGRQPLHPDSKKFTRLSFIVRLIVRVDNCVY